MGWALGENAEMKYITTIGNNEFTIEVLDEDTIVLDGKTYNIDFESIGEQFVFSLLVDGNSHEAYVFPSEAHWEVLYKGILYPITVEDEREKRLRSSFGGSLQDSREYYLKAPMPGLVISILVQDGQQIAKGDVLVILESMKMQNELKAPRDGRISRLRVKEGDNVDRKQTLLSVI
jgi:biotin carboxyl carrier protein